MNSSGTRIGRLLDVDWLSGFVFSAELSWEVVAGWLCCGV
jgi:hypothetical protein